MRKVILIASAAFCLSPCFAADLNFVSEPFPPYSYPVSSSNSAAAGPMAEIMQIACSRMRIQCHTEIMPWRQAYSKVTNGGVDGIFSLMPTEDRKKTLYFTDVIVGGAYTFFAPVADHITYRNPSDLDGRTVAVYGPSGTSTALENIIDQTTARSVMELSNDILLEKLKKGLYGEHALVLMNRDVANVMLKQHAIMGMRPAGDLLPVAYAFAFSRKRANQMLVIQFDNTIKTMLKDGSIRTILHKYGLNMARNT
jgi:polar amino acid transport system substrate-binding protein